MNQFPLVLVVAAFALVFVLVGGLLALLVVLLHNPSTKRQK